MFGAEKLLNCVYFTFPPSTTPSADPILFIKIMLILALSSFCSAIFWVGNVCCITKTTHEHLNKLIGFSIGTGALQDHGDSFEQNDLVVPQGPVFDVPSVQVHTGVVVQVVAPADLP